MMEKEASAVLGMLEKNGWRTTPTNGGWEMRRKPEEGIIVMSITPQHWLCFSSPLLMEPNMTVSPLTDEDGIRLYRSFLEQNEHMFVAKFALDPDDNPLLMTEVSLKDGHPQLPYWAIESIARYQVKGIHTILMEAELAQATSEATEPHSVVKIRLIETAAMSADIPTTMTSVADDTIELYLKGVENLGWRIKQKVNSFTWHLFYQGYYHWFDVYLTTSKNWVYFQMPVLLDRAATVLTQTMQTKETQQQQLLFLKYLLRLNHHYFMAKLGISSDSQVLLLLELPTETLDFSLFRQALLALGTYFDRFEQEIQIMASLQQNKRLLELLHM